MRIALDSTELARWTSPILVTSAAAICVWLSIRLLSGLIDHLLTGPDASPTGAAATASWTQAQPESLARWHLFGSAFSAADLRSPVDAPETSLELTLVGTLADSDPAAGVAIIAAADGRQSAYRSGANLPGGARLRSIHSNHVVLVLNGRDEVLRLPRELAQSPAIPAAGATAPGSGHAPARSGGTPIAPVAVAGLETVDWTSVQQQMRIDPAELARQVRILPVFEGGQMVGVRLSGGANTPLLAKLGLRPDDVIVAVNGVSVLDTGRAHQVITAVASAERATVTIRRDGREETLNVSLQ